MQTTAERLIAQTRASDIDALRIHVVRQPLSDGSSVYDVHLGSKRIIAVNEKAAWKIADTLRKLLDDDAISLTPANVTCNY